VKGGKLGALAITLVLAGGAAAASFAGCNGDGVTPNCSLPDGAYDPESGCGQLVEAAVPFEDAGADQTSPGVDSGTDSTAPPGDASDAGHDSGDGGHSGDASDSGFDSSDGHITDAHNDAKG
jgi:hypothetical protein